ncbi:MAG TPA: hypothetical protein GX733_03575 [Tissierellia bacterium]|jgi:hypothetical protein|nr:hypothetical protein [Tissierellia bacterium]
MKKEHIAPSVDVVDHEEKNIQDSEDFVTHEGNLKEQSEEVSDTMKQQKKQVSAEIHRSDFSDQLKDKGC